MKPGDTVYFLDRLGVDAAIEEGKLDAAILDGRLRGFDNLRAMIDRHGQSHFAPVEFVGETRDAARALAALQLLAIAARYRAAAEGFARNDGC